MTDGPLDVLSPEKATAYSQEQLQAFGRWRRRSKLFAYPAGIVAFAAAFAAMGSFGTSGALALIVAIVVGIVVSTVVEWIVMPAVALPTLRCPYCANQVPIAEKPNALKPLERTKRCPSCNRELPH